MALKLASGAHFGYNRYCKANPVDLEGSRGQVLEVLNGFWWVLGGTWPRDPFQRVGLEKWCRTHPKLDPETIGRFVTIFWSGPTINNLKCVTKRR